MECRAWFQKEQTVTPGELKAAHDAFSSAYNSYRGRALTEQAIHEACGSAWRQWRAENNRTFLENYGMQNVNEQLVGQELFGGTRMESAGFHRTPQPKQTPLWKLALWMLGGGVVVTLAITGAIDSLLDFGALVK